MFLNKQRICFAFFVASLTGVLITCFENCSISNFELNSVEMGSSLVGKQRKFSDFSVGSASIATPAAESMMEELFGGRAQLSLVRKMPETNAGGAWIFVNEGIWYLYDRKPLHLPVSTVPDMCKRGEDTTWGITVRESHDKGLTWSDEKFIVKPTLNPNSADACQVLDGATFFDSETGTWHIWAQCLGSSLPDSNFNRWSMCHYVSHGPTEEFNRPINFLSGGGSIWKDICSKPNSGCEVNVSDEGTPEILYKKDGYFYVTFHGFLAPKGYRGMARTKDFVSFETTGGNIPQGAFMIDQDAQSWNPGSIGPGKGSTIITSQFIYQLIEAPTVDLRCTPGQNWPVGLVRAALGSGHGSWAPAADSPLIRPEAGVSCGISYANIFVDGDDLYVYYLRYFNEMRTPREWNLYKVTLKNDPKNDPKLSTMPLPSPTPPSSPPVVVQKVEINPLLQYRIGDNKFNDNAWVGYSADLGNKYCQFRYGPMASVDLKNSVPVQALLNICNVDILKDQNTGVLYCELGISGSNYSGFVYSKIACSVPTGP